MASSGFRSLFSLVLAAALYLPLLFSRHQVSAGEVSLTRKQREFDYFALALQWPGTYCKKTSHCCPQNGCCRSTPLTGFTIHGLWPDYDDGTWPACCSNSDDFDIKKIKPLIGTLEKYWPSLSCSSSSLCHGGKGLFWAHEWEKHGTCSYPVVQDEFSYFTTVLDLYFKYNITEILNNAGVLATNAEKYPLVDIASVIEKAVGASPQLICKKGSLEELRICFYKDFKPRDCIMRSGVRGDAVNSKSSCPEYVSLPTYAPIDGISEVEDVGAAFSWFI